MKRRGELLEGFLDVALVIHYWEAWLATLAIIVWHFFFVIFHPDAYPVSWTWLNGKMPKHEVRERHPEWYAELEGPKTRPGDEAAKAKD